MKTRMPAICFLLLLAQTICAIEQIPLSNPPVDEYGIELDRSYPGTLVAELLQAIEEEAAASVEEAYAEGYKAGRIDAVAVWNPLYDAANGRADRAWSQARSSNLWTLFYGIATGISIAAVACALSR